MNLEQAKEELTPKSDIIFKRLFGRAEKSEKIIEFLEAILNLKIKSIKLEKETQILPENIDEKARYT